MSTTTATAEVLGGLEQEHGHTRREPVAAVAERPVATGHSRLVDAAVMSLIVAFQTAWLGALGYVAWLLVA